MRSLPRTLFKTLRVPAAYANHRTYAVAPVTLIPLRWFQVLFCRWDTIGYADVAIACTRLIIATTLQTNSSTRAAV